MQYRFGIRMIQPEIFETIQAEKKPLYISSHCSRPGLEHTVTNVSRCILAEKADNGRGHFEMSRSITHRGVKPFLLLQIEMNQEAAENCLDL